MPTPTYSICPIPLCEGPRQGSHFTARMNFDSTYQMICYAWYIKGSQPKVLVDPGAPASLFTDIQGIKEQKNIMSIEDGLTKLGVKPEKRSAFIPSRFRMIFSPIVRKTPSMARKAAVAGILSAPLRITGKMGWPLGSEICSEKSGGMMMTLNAPVTNGDREATQKALGDVLTAIYPAAVSFWYDNGGPQADPRTPAQGEAHAE